MFSGFLVLAVRKITNNKHNLNNSNIDNNIQNCFVLLDN